MSVRLLRRWLPRNRRNPLSRSLQKYASLTVRLMENDNYSIAENGERRILERLSAIGFDMPVLDVGANVGEYSLAARELLPKAPIHAFEPVGETYARLVAQTAGRNIDAHHYGLGEKDEVLTFAVRGDLALSTLHGSFNGDVGRSERAQIRDAAKVVRELGISSIGLLKIDTEGHDWFVLRGLESYLASGAIKVIQFEYGTVSIVTHKLLMDFYSLLAPLGYSVGKIYPDYVDFRGYLPEHEDFIGPNFLAVHESFDASIFH